MSTYQYFFKEDKFLAIKNKAKADPQRIGEALEEVRLNNKGKLTPVDAVKAAADRNNPLHPHLEWDDEKAGHAHRLHQMRSLINSIDSIELGTATARQMPAFVSIRGAESVAYRRTGDVLRSAYLTKRLLEQAKGELLAFQRRYQRFELLVRAVDEPIKIVDVLIEQEGDDDE